MTRDADQQQRDALRIVTEIIVKELAIPEEQVRPNTDLVKELGIDTDDLSFLYVPAVHKRFDVVLPNDEWRKIATPLQTVDAVLEARARQGVPGPLR